MGVTGEYRFVRADSHAAKLVPSVLDRSSRSRMNFTRIEVLAPLARNSGRVLRRAMATTCSEGASHVGPDPEAAPLEQQGFGWKSSYGTGKGRDAITSGIEVTWTSTPTTWDNSFFETLFGYEWELTASPAGAHQWQPKDGAGAGTVPAPQDPSLRRPPTMLTTDLSLRLDPVYEPISPRFLANPAELADAFARAG